MMIIIASLFITLLYVRLILTFVKTWKSMPTTTVQQRVPDVSVVVVFRNEADNLVNLLNDLADLKLREGLLEIILINDNSTDHGVDLIEDWCKHNSLDVRIQTLNAHTNKYKKEGIELAVTLAKYESILLTDADCRLPKNWLTLMSSPDPNTLNCGPVNFTKETNLWHKILQLEVISLSAMAGCTINLNQPMLANGANMSYSKTLFNTIGGFQLNTVKQSASGDDVSMLRSVYKLKDCKINFVKNSKAIVETHPPKGFSEFFFQRIRWAGKTKFDLNEPGALISVQLIGMYLLLFTLPLVAWWSNYNQLFLLWGICYLLKFAVDLIFFHSILSFFKRRSLMKYVAIAEIFHLFYIVPMAILSMFVAYKWKGRKMTHG